MAKWMGEIKIPEKEVVVVESREEVVSRRATLFLSLFSLIFSLFFLTQNITGNAIAGFTVSSAGWVGAILFILAIIGFLVYVNKKK